MVKGEGKRFSEGRDGDHLMGIPLQCELLHIRNIEVSNLIARDEGLLIIMRRENLDACWGTEPSTVGGNFGSLRRMRSDALEGKLFSYPLSQFGLFPLDDSVVMIQELLVLQQFLKQGRYKDYLQ